MILRIAALAVVLVAAAPRAEATPVLWTLNNWNLAVGGAVTGTFVYDADTGTYSSINVTADDGTSLTLAGPNASATILQFVPVGADLTGTTTALGQLGNPGMTNAGGTLFILTAGGTEPNSSESICSNADCSSFGSPDFLTAGNISGTPVPAPTAAWLLSSAAVGLSWMGRRRLD